MTRKIFVLLIVVVTILFSSCKNSTYNKVAIPRVAKNRILQQEDGTISLKVDKADCYHDIVNPSVNTAEWNVVVSKSGRYNVWLSSATKDTTNLKYHHSVMLSVLDNRLEKTPGCDKIITNSKEVTFPWFRADSFMGSMYIQDTGLYNIQIISEKISPGDLKKGESAGAEDSKLLSVFFTPIRQ